MDQFRRFFADRRGATAVEYALVAASIAVVIVGAVAGLGQQVSGLFNTVAASPLH
jgi:pilus assembly protein Flp/PilA